MKFIKNIVSGIFQIIICFYNYENQRKITNIFNLIYSFWLKYNISESGANVGFNRPVYMKGGKYIRIGNNFGAGPGFRIEALDLYQNTSYLPQIDIGNNVHFNFNCHIGAINKIIIKDNVLVGSNVLITDHSHGDTTINALKIKPIERFLVSKGPVIIEENVWIGEGVSILSNVCIGRNSIIGCNSVITKDVKPFSIVVGNPAIEIKSFQIDN